MNPNPQVQGSSNATEAAPAMAAESESVVDAAVPPMPAGVPGAEPRPGVAQGADAYPDGPNVEASPWELDAARGKLPDPPA